MKFTLLSQPLGLLKPMLNVFRTITSASILLKRGDAEEGMVDYVTEMIAKHSCKYYEYGSIEYLLFLSLGEYMLLSDWVGKKKKRRRRRRRRRKRRRKRGRRIRRREGGGGGEEEEEEEEEEGEEGKRTLACIRMFMSWFHLKLVWWGTSESSLILSLVSVTFIQGH